MSTKTEQGLASQGLSRFPSPSDHWHELKRASEEFNIHTLICNKTEWSRVQQVDTAFFFPPLLTWGQLDPEGIWDSSSHMAAKWQCGSATHFPPPQQNLMGKLSLYPTQRQGKAKSMLHFAKEGVSIAQGVAKHPLQPSVIRLYQFSSRLLPVWGQWGPVRNWIHTYPASPHIMSQQGDCLLESEMEYHPRSHNIICKISRIWFFLNHSL